MNGTCHSGWHQTQPVTQQKTPAEREGHTAHMDGEDSDADTPQLDVVHISIEEARDSKASVGHDRDTLALMIQEHR